MPPKRERESAKLIRAINDTAKKVKYGDLYNALHNVGDDPLKADIEETLRNLLDEKTFKTVVAVFKYGVKVYAKFKYGVKVYAKARG